MRIVGARRRKPIGMVFPRVFVAADTDERPVKKPHHGCEQLGPAQVCGAQIPFHARAQERKNAAEHQHTAKLGLIAHAAAHGSPLAASRSMISCSTPIPVRPISRASSRSSRGTLSATSASRAVCVLSSE